jgi:GNAT superfamily N-acetyltransferase
VIYTLVHDERPDQADVDVLGRGLAGFNHQMAGESGYRPLAIFLRDEQGKMVGGIYGSTFWSWFTIDLLWIEEDVRGQGYGDRLLAAAEEEAVRRGCKRACLDTLSFQAPEFYKKRGYAVFGEIDDFPPGHSRIYMVKQLDDSTAQSDVRPPST